MDLVLGLIVAPAMIAAGWAAWTGRWRSWAHPYSGRGLLPILLLPIGFTILWIPFVSGEDTPGWTAIVALPAIVAFPLLLLNFFHDFKRWPPLLRPRWIPADAPVPLFRDPRATPAMLGMGRVEVPSEEVATRLAEGQRPRLAHWEVLLVEEDPAVPYLNVAGTGIRICRLDVYEKAVTLYQQSPEDRLRGQNLAIAFHHDDVRRIEFLPAPGFSWRAFVQPRARLNLPRLVLHASNRKHEVMVRDPKFTRHVQRSLDLIAGALNVEVSRG